MHTFNIITLNQPAVVERLLRVVRHRSFAIHSLTVNAKDEQLTIELSVVGERPVEPLFNQIQKLYDVTNIGVTSSPPTSRIDS